VKRPRLWLTLLLSIVLGVGSLLVALPGGVGVDALRAVARLDATALALVVATILGWWAVSAWRLIVLARAAKERLGFLQAVQAHVVGTFSAVVTPAGGGNSVGIAYLLYRFGVKPQNAATIAVMCVVGDMTFFAWALPVAALGLRVVGIELPVLHLGWLVAGLSILAALASYVLVFRLELAVRALRGLLALRLFRWLRIRTDAFLGRLELAGRRVARRRWSWHMGFLLLSSLMRLVYFAVLLVILSGLGAEVPWGTAFSAQVLVHAFAFAIPTPGASGYQEASLSLALRGQLTATTLSAAIILWRLAQHYLYFLVAPLIGGLAHLRWAAETHLDDAAEPDADAQDGAWSR
jgi:uncharacterized protein (TIRG00374 family)